MRMPMFSIRDLLYVISFCFFCSSPLFAEMTPEDYALLSTVLSHGFGDSCQQIAIEERSSPGSVALSSENMSIEEVAEILGIDQQLLTNWQKTNSDFDYFNEQFELSCSYHLISSKELSSIFDNTIDDNPETGWRNFRKALPNLVGVMRLSKPVMDHEAKKALAYIEFDCGPACGSGRFVSLSKGQENRWQVSGGSLVWMASE